MQIDFNNPSIQAFRITSSADSPAAAHCYFIFDENDAYLLECNTLLEHWTIVQISFDASGGEIVTKERDTIYLSKEIIIKRIDGEKMSLEYEPIDINCIAF